jgi:hypothetical protein
MAPPNNFRTQLQHLAGGAFDAGRISLPDPTHGEWPTEPYRFEAIEAIEELVSKELLRHRVGPPVAFLGCTLRQDYSDRTFQVVSVGEGDQWAGGGHAQLVSLDEAREFLEVDVVTLMRDFAIDPTASLGGVGLEEGDRLQAAQDAEREKISKWLDRKYETQLAEQLRAGAHLEG